MKKELIIHFSFLVSFLIFISLLKGWLHFSYWQFWLGGLVGTLLPDLDHLIYIFFLKPQELTSQRVNYMLGKKEIWKTLQLLAETRSERTKLIFHSVLFQIIFWVFAFLMITSSGSLFGRGIVLAFMLHLVIDEVVDLRELGSLANWFRQTPVSLNKDQAKKFWVLNIALLLIFGFLL